MTHDARKPAADKLLSAVCALVAGGLYGWLVSRLPATQGHVFWPANLAGPWLAIPFAAGWTQRSPVWSGAVGALADVGATCGFYTSALLIDGRRSPQQPATPLADRITGNLVHWLGYIAPWVALAVVAGSLCGYAGFLRRNRSSAQAMILIGAALVIEPFVWTVVLGYTASMALWACEIITGLCVIAWAAAPARFGPRARRP